MLSGRIYSSWLKFPGNERITAEGFRHLQNLQYLTELSICNSNISESSILDLAAVSRNLRKIKLSQSQWTAGGLLS